MEVECDDEVALSEVFVPGTRMTPTPPLTLDGKGEIGNHESDCLEDEARDSRMIGWLILEIR